MRTIFLFFITWSFFSSSTFSQTLTAKELRNLHGKLFDVLSQDNIENPERPSEFVLCFLEIDSSGKVNGVNLLSDDKNKGATYNILSRTTPGAFKNWKAANCKGRTLMIPVLFLATSNRSPEYIEGVKDLYSSKLNQLPPPLAIVNETGKLITISPFQYQASISKHSTPNSTNKKTDIQKATQ